MVILTGCQKQDVMTDTPSPQPSPEAPATYVLADLALSLPSPSAAGTRLAESVVQAEGQPFRGIQKLTIVPFSKQGRIGLDDQPLYAEIDHLYVDNTIFTAKEQLWYYSKVYLKHGVASFLTYGQATLPASYQKKEYGSLVLKLEDMKVTEVPEKMTVTPANLNFELEPIYDVRDEGNHVVTPSEATAIADYMTSIAQAQADETHTWANSENERLKPLYENFVAKSGEGFDVLAGSAANVKAYVKQLKEKLDNYDFEGTELAIKTDIISRIDNETMSAACEGNYPGNMNLPDGAAVLQWCAKEDGTYGFVPQTQTTTIAPISGIYRYAYPPELYYFGNSQIKTSNTEVTTADYTDKPSWADIVNTSYTFGNAVTPNTRAVAIKDPLQYGVAQLQATVQAMTDEMKDAKTPEPNTVNVGSETFPITGIIVSGQFPVNFDFTPQYDGASDDNEHFVYDSQLGNHYLTTTATDPFRTLLLQTHVGEKVKVILELQNNSNTDFTGENNGIVYRGTKFYLLGEVTPPQGKPVFKQDEITTMEMKVNTLKHAYNVMPNIQSGRLEVSVEINLKWTQATPQTIEFEE